MSSMSSCEARKISAKILGYLQLAQSNEPDSPHRARPGSARFMQCRRPRQPTAAWPHALKVRGCGRLAIRALHTRSSPPGGFESFIDFLKPARKISARGSLAGCNSRTLRYAARSSK